LIILGLDPGSITTGFGVIELAGRDHRFVDCGCLKASTKRALPARLVQLYDGVAETLCQCQPDEVAIEEVFYRLNAATAFKMSHVRGVLMLAVAKAGLPISEYAPREVKQAVVGTGSASKAQVQFMVKNILRLRQMPASDAADALAVALCHAHRLTSAVQR
jgi:crossover junction endodeoxyribonuclease RuvC